MLIHNIILRDQSQRRFTSTSYDGQRKSEASLTWSLNDWNFVIENGTHIRLFNFNKTFLKWIKNIYFLTCSRSYVKIMSFRDLKATPNFSILKKLNCKCILIFLNRHSKKKLFWCQGFLFGVFNSHQGWAFGPCYQERHRTSRVFGLRAESYGALGMDTFWYICFQRYGNRNKVFFL